MTSARALRIRSRHYLTENRPYKPFTEGRITEIMAATASEPSTQTSTDTAAKSVTPDAKPAEGAEAAASTTTAEKPAAETPAAQTTTTEQPAAETPAADTSATTTQPAAETPVAASDATPTVEKHVVVRGDTLWDLAKSVYGDGELWSRIAQASGNPVPEKLEIGTELTIPAK